MQTGETSWVSQMMLDVGYFINSGVLCRARRERADRPRTSQNSHVAPTAAHCQSGPCDLQQVPRQHTLWPWPLIMHSQHSTALIPGEEMFAIIGNVRSQRHNIKHDSRFSSFYRLLRNYSMCWISIGFFFNLLLVIVSMTACFVESAAHVIEVNKNTIKYNL